MNILFFNWEFPPRGSGIGRYIYHMSQALRDIGCFTVIVTSYGDEGPSETRIKNGIIYRSYRFDEVGDASVAQFVLEKASEHNIDWIEGADHLGEADVLLSVGQRPPVIIKVHYNDVLRVARYAHAHFLWQKPLIFLACLRYQKRLQREKRSMASADLLLSPSQRILDELRLQNVHLSEKQSVVPNPIPSLTCWSNHEALHPTLLLVGRIDIGKGIGYLPRLIKTLLPQFPLLSVEIAGGDSYARILGSTRRWLTNSLGALIEYVKFLGELDENALNDAYARAWVVIVPSNWDTFPTVVLEAMIRGKAIVSSKHGGMPEMLAETQCVTADPDGSQFFHAVSKFLLDRQLREEAGKSAQLRAKTIYSPAHVADSYIRLLKNYS